MKEFLFKKIECKKCGYKSAFTECVLMHLIFKHKIKPTKNDFIFSIKYSVLGKLILGLLLCVKLVIKLICYPFHWIYENL